MAGLGPLVQGALRLWVSHPLQASTDPMIHVRQLRPGWALDPSLVTEGLSELAGSEGQNPDRERHPACTALRAPPGTPVPSLRWCLSPSVAVALPQLCRPGPCWLSRLLSGLFKILSAEVCFE